MGARPFAILLTLCALAGCLARPSGEPFRPEVVPDGSAVIYVFRDVQRVRNRPMRVLVDQVDAGDLAAGQYLALAVEPGTHLVRVAANAEGSREVTLRAGESAYVRVVARRFRPRQPKVDVPDDDRARTLIARTFRAPGVRDSAEPAIGID